MKRKLLLLAVLVVTSSIVAQNSNDGVGKRKIQDQRKNLVQVGVKAGANLNMMNVNDFEYPSLNEKNGMGFEVGLVGTVQFGKRLGGTAGSGRWAAQIEPTFAYHTIGTDYENMKFSYFEVPVMGKFYIIPSLNVELGVNLCTLIGSSPKTMKDIPDGNGVDFYDYHIGDFKGFDVRPFVGVSYEMKKQFFASLRYSLGTSELAKNYPGKMSTVNLTLGYRFDIFKF